MGAGVCVCVCVCVRACVVYHGVRLDNLKRRFLLKDTTAGCHADLEIFWRSLFPDQAQGSNRPMESVHCREQAIAAIVAHPDAVLFAFLQIVGFLLGK